MLRTVALLLGCGLGCGLGCTVGAEAQRTVLQRDNATVVLEGYAPGIVRVTLSLDSKFALQGPGVGISATADAAGWTHTVSNDDDLYRSKEMVVRVAPPYNGKTSGTGKDIAKYFVGSTPDVGINILFEVAQNMVPLLLSTSVESSKESNAANAICSGAIGGRTAYVLRTTSSQRGTIPVMK